MNFIENLGDCTNVPEFAVGGVARVEIIDNCIVRMTLYKPLVDHNEPHTPVCELVWTIPAWIAAGVPLAEVAVEITRTAIGAPSCPETNASLSHH